MAINQLTAIQVTKLSTPGRYADGGGLYLYVKTNGNKFWELRFQLNKRRRAMGLGAFNKAFNGLADARKKAAINRALIADGIDPIEQAKDIEAQRLADIEIKQAAIKLKNEENTVTFEFCAQRYIKNKQAEWKNAKHKQQWHNTLEKYAYPAMGHIPINKIEMSHVRQILDPIWNTKTETANRVRQRIEAVISSAIAIGERETANPAVWKGLLDNFYPKPEKMKRKRNIAKGTDGHHPALPYDELPEFMAELVKVDGLAAMALRFLILTVPRTTELRLAKPDEINSEKKIWTIPQSRMKSGIRHRVALSEQAIQLFQSTPRINEYIFAGWKHGCPLSDGGLRSVLKRMGRLDITVHGFRSTFRDYIGEETNFPDRLAEFALAHQLSDEAEKAYARGDKLKKRFDMMNAWATYCDSKLGNKKVIPIVRRTAD